MINLCAPAIIYLIFSITQILIDLYKGLYNTAFMKIIVASMVTLLLNILCAKGLSVVSWIIVFIPFILMTVMVSLLLYFFGLNATTGTLDYTCKDNTSSTTSSTTSTSTNVVYPDGVTTDAYGNIIIYDPEYNPYQHPVYYQSPNIIVPNPYANDVYKPKVVMYPSVPSGSSSPEYQS
jgi:glucan phosphoethanolaminetransferase (alkaline phosphatase superfamily)